MKEMQVRSLVGSIPWSRKWQLTPVILPGKFYVYGQRSLMGYSPWGHKELDRTECRCTHTFNTNGMERIIGDSVRTK